MSTGLAVLTWGLFLLPAAFLWGALTTPPPISSGFYGITAFIVAIYASVWFFWRPTRFEVEGHQMHIVWPARTRTIDLHDVEGARILEGREFRDEYGWGMRIGAGGLWGGFGLLKTTRVTFSMWISRLDPLVIVTLRGARPLLVTPEDPELFVATITRHARA